MTPDAMEKDWKDSLQSLAVLQEEQMRSFREELDERYRNASLRAQILFERTLARFDAEHKEKIDAYTQGTEKIIAEKMRENEKRFSAAAADPMEQELEDVLRALTEVVLP